MQKNELCFGELAIFQRISAVNFLKLLFGKPPKTKSIIKAMTATQSTKKPIKIVTREETSGFEYAASLLDKDDRGYFIEPEDSFDLEIVGEASYQTALGKIAGPKSETGANITCSAVMLCENDNKYDKNAVCIKIDGMVVGYLSKTDAKNWRKMLKREDINDESVRVQANIVGGWRSEKKGQVSEGSFGVKLDVPVDAE